MAIDLGDKRTGLAVGDMQTRIASPAGVLEVAAAQRDGAALVEAIVRAIEEHGAGALVVGLPLNMDGSEGPRAKQARAFAGRLARATGLAVEMQDERLTSSAADWRMARTGLTRAGKKMKRDALAAAALLEDYLAARAGDTRPLAERGDAGEPSIG